MEPCCCSGVRPERHNQSASLRLRLADVRLPNSLARLPARVFTNLPGDAWMQSEFRDDYLPDCRGALARLGFSGTMVSPRANIATSSAIFFARPAGVFILFVRNASANRF